MNLSERTWLSIILVVFIIAAGFFAYQWWQVKGELAKNLTENENLVKQANKLQAEIDKLQKEIEELKISEEIKDETAEWKTYRNEEYGFEIDYPKVGWGIKETHFWADASPFAFDLYQLSYNGDEAFFHFYIDGEVWLMAQRCESLDWKEIMNDIYDCTEEQIYTMNFEKEIITDAGVKRYQVKVKDSRGEMKGVLFPTSRLKWDDEEALRSCILFTYYVEPKPDLEEIKLFDQVISSFGFIEK